MKPRMPNNNYHTVTGRYVDLPNTRATSETSPPITESPDTTCNDVICYMEKEESSTDSIVTTENNVSVTSTMEEFKQPIKKLVRVGNRFIYIDVGTPNDTTIQTTPETDNRKKYRRIW